MCMVSRGDCGGGISALRKRSSRMETDPRATLRFGCFDRWVDGGVGGWLSLSWEGFADRDRGVCVHWGSALCLQCIAVGVYGGMGECGKNTCSVMVDWKVRSGVSVRNLILVWGQDKELDVGRLDLRLIAGRFVWSTEVVMRVVGWMGTGMHTNRTNMLG